jgi:hypothetical protein
MKNGEFTQLQEFFAEFLSLIYQYELLTRGRTPSLGYYHGKYDD